MYSSATLLLAGALGGLLRGLVGFLKHQLAYKNVEFNIKYILMTMALSAFVGITVTWAIVESNLNIPVLNQVNPAIAMIIGYAGGDLIENLYKIMVGKDSIYKDTIQK